MIGIIISISFTYLYCVQLIILWVIIVHYGLKYLGIKTKKDLFIHHIPLYIPALKAVRYLKETFKELK